MEIKKGTFFTVDSWKKINDRSYIGACLEAKVVDGNFVRVRRHYNNRHTDSFTLDLRQVNIVPLSDDFVKAVMDDDRFVVGQLVAE